MHTLIQTWQLRPIPFQYYQKKKERNENNQKSIRHKSLSEFSMKQEMQCPLRTTTRALQACQC